jgi:viroplasmin and RNaseH domain-containing protein
MSKQTKPLPLKLSKVPFIQTGESIDQYIEKLKEYCVTFHSEVKDIQFNSEKEKASYFMWLMINSNIFSSRINKHLQKQY